MDAELELLSLDAGAELAAGALVRGGTGAQGSFAFHGERLSMEIEVDGAGIVGQLTPPQPGQVTLVSAEGPQATAQADEIGCHIITVTSDHLKKLSLIGKDLNEYSRDTVAMFYKDAVSAKYAIPLVPRRAA